MGYLFRFNLYSTHGDFYYIGLNGIEMFDQNGQDIDLKGRVYGNPEGVFKLKGMESDTRTIDKITDRVNQTYDEMHMWLAPFKNTRSF